MRQRVDAEQEQKKKVGSLLQRPRPMPGEGPCGYILRLAQANHFEASLLFNLLEIEPEKTFSVGLWHSYSRKFSEWLHGTPEEFAQLFEYPLRHEAFAELTQADAYMLRKDDPADTARSLVAFGRPRFCPHCLREGGFWDKRWEMLPFTACLKHQVLLVDRCHRCREVLDWKSVSFCKCTECGANLADAVASPVGDWASLNTWADDLLERWPLSGPLPFLPNHALSFEALAELFVGVGLSFSAEFSRPLYERRPWRFSNRELHGMSLVTAALLSADEDVRRGLLSQFLRARAMNDLALPPNIALAPLFRRFRGKAPRVFAATRTVLEEDFMAPPLGEEGVKVGEPPLWVLWPHLPAGAVAREDAQRILGADEATLSALIERGVLSDGKKWSPEELKAARRALERSLTYAEALELLGLSKDALDSFVAEGLVRPWQGPEVDGQRETLFLIDDFALLFLQMEKAVLCRATTRPADFPENGDVALVGTQMLRWVLEGSLSCIWQDESRSGLAKYRFDRREVRRLDPQSTIPPGFVSVEDGVEILGVYPDLVRSLVFHGHIEAVRGSVNNAIHIVEKSLRLFHGRYVTSAELATRTGRSAKHMVARLALLEIHPIGGPGVDGTLTAFFERNAVEERFAELCVIKLSNAIYQHEVSAANRADLRRESGIVSLRDVARALNVSEKRVQELERQGFLMRVERSGREKKHAYYTERSLSEYMSQVFFNDGLISLKNALMELGCTRYQQILRRWVHRGLISPVDTGLGKMFRREQVEACKKDAELIISIKEAATILELKEETLKTLVKRKKVKPLHGPGVDGIRVYLFDKAAVLELKARGEALLKRQRRAAS